MIHPHTSLQKISDEIGHGVFATAPILAGTIVVVLDAMDRVLSPETFHALPEPLFSRIDNFVYRRASGDFVLSWDHARYMNHHCDSNTKMTAYGLEIAVRDIAAGEELTTEYGLLNVLEPYPLFCGCHNCRETLRTDDLATHAATWDEQILNALLQVGNCEQALLPLLPADTKVLLEKLPSAPQAYKSVLHLQC